MTIQIFKKIKNSCTKYITQLFNFSTLRCWIFCNTFFAWQWKLLYLFCYSFHTIANNENIGLVLISYVFSYHQRGMYDAAVWLVMLIMIFYVVAPPPCRSLDFLLYKDIEISTRSFCAQFMHHWNTAQRNIKNNKYIAIKNQCIRVTIYNAVQYYAIILLFAKWN